MFPAPYIWSSTFVFANSASAANVNLATLARAAGWDGQAPLQCTLSGTITSASTLTAALTIGTTVAVVLINTGTIAGAGGHGGNGASTFMSSGFTYLPGTVGTAGGDAILTTGPLTIINSGTIGGGGGGGGGGPSQTGVSGVANTSGGGGGGGGAGFGGGGSGGTGTNESITDGNGNPGSAGGLTTGGARGTTSPAGDSLAGANGGNGGNLGVAGSASANTDESPSFGVQTITPMTGGAAGRAVRLGSGGSLVSTSGNALLGVVA